MTHRALLVEVWGAAWSDDTATLRTHVANLRRKIEPADGERADPHRPGRRLPNRSLKLGVQALRSAGRSRSSRKTTRTGPGMVWTP